MNLLSKYKSLAQEAEQSYSLPVVDDGGENATNCEIAYALKTVVNVLERQERGDFNASKSALIMQNVNASESRGHVKAVYSAAVNDII